MVKVSACVQETNRGVEKSKNKEGEEGGACHGRCVTAEVLAQGNTFSRSFVTKRSSKLNMLSPASVCAAARRCVHTDTHAWHVCRHKACRMQQEFNVERSKGVTVFLKLLSHVKTNKAHKTKKHLDEMFHVPAVQKGGTLRWRKTQGKSLKHAPLSEVSWQLDASDEGSEERAF